MPKRANTTKPTECTASVSDNNNHHPGVEKMYYSVYTFSYTNQPDTIYFFWEPADLTRMLEIEHVFTYYKTMFILESFSCNQVDMTLEALQDLMIMMGEKDSLMTRAEFEIIEPLLMRAKVETETTMKITSSDVLGYVTFFNQNWYVPAFPSRKLVWKMVPTHLPSDVLLGWYETKLSNITKTKEQGNQLEKGPSIEHKTIWDRCAILIANNSSQNITMESVEQQKVDIPMNEMIDLYLQLYLESSTQKEVLLSEVYQDYKERILKINQVPTTQASFIKQLRSHDRFKIVRQARGMVLTNYSILSADNVIEYMHLHDAYSFEHSVALANFKKEYPNSKIPNLREAFFLISISTSILPSYYAMQFFLSDKKMESVVKKFETYLDSLEDDEKIRSETEKLQHDDLNDYSRTILEARNELLKKVNSVGFKFPFSFNVARPTMINKKKAAEMFDGLCKSQRNGYTIQNSVWETLSENDPVRTFMNQYSYE